MGTQLHSFDALRYTGNPELCSPPLTKNCSSSSQENGPSHVGQAGEAFLADSEFYMGMAVGFVVGFWGICSLLFFNRTCRHAYFQFIEQLKYLLCVPIVLKVRWLFAKISSLVSKVRNITF